MSRKNNKNKVKFHLNSIEALNEKQREVLSSNKHLVLAGSAGTGKTFLASYLAYYGLLREDFNQVMFIRSSVSTRNIGFLPGSEKEKMRVYKQPYIDITSKLLDRGDAFEILEKCGDVRFEPTSFVRGLTFENTFIVVDECQNMTYHELDSLITRIDDKCRIIFCGDINQADLYKNGFGDFYKVLEKMEQFKTITFEIDDVVRGDLVKSYLRTKEALLN